MFTGLIEEVGRVHRIRATGLRHAIGGDAPLIAADLREGDSVAVNGCCLTATTIVNGDLTFDLLGETIARTNLRTLGAESPVNLERALAAAGRFGGHFVQGHIDCTAGSSVPSPAAPTIESRSNFRPPSPNTSRAGFGRAEWRQPNDRRSCFPASFVVWIIPHTRRQTNFDRLQTDDLLNVEFDILAKYVERMLPKIAL